MTTRKVRLYIRLQNIVMQTRYISCLNLLQAKAIMKVSLVSNMINLYVSFNETLIEGQNFPTFFEPVT